MDPHNILSPFYDLAASLGIHVFLCSLRLIIPLSSPALPANHDVKPATIRLWSGYNCRVVEWKETEEEAESKRYMVMA